jgi:DNA-binding NarL/FixJ family response regulator
MSSISIRVVVADDDEFVRELVAAVIAEQGDMTVVGSAADGLGALALVRDTRPDIAVIDLVMPHGGAALACQLLAEAPELCIVVLSSEPEASVRDAVLEAGAARFVRKVAALDIVTELRAAVANFGRRPLPDD